MNPQRIAIVVVGLLTAAAATQVFVNSPGKNRLITRTLAAQPLSDAEIRSRLEAQGFSNIQNLRHGGDRVILTATKGGKTSQLAIDPITGDIAPTARSDDGDDDD